MSDDKDYDKPISQLPEEERLKCFVEWHKLSSEFFREQNERVKEDLLIAQDPKNAWDELAKKMRDGRPMLSVSISGGPLKHVINQASAAQFGVDLKPINEKAQTKLADYKKGMFSRIQRDGFAHQARMWAFKRAAQGGIGWYRITTDWDEDSDNPTDQEIVYERLLHQENVMSDPAATKPDFSDGRFLITGAYVPCREFHKRYPNAEKYNKSDFAALLDKMPGWVNQNGDDLDPLVVEVFYKESLYETVTVGTYERLRERPQVRRAVCTGCEILEDELWLVDANGRGRIYIPFVPVVGDEQIPVDGKRYWVGMIREGGQIDAQKGFNFGISQMVEDVSASSKAKYILYDGQIEGYEQLWEDMNLTTRAYLPIKSVMLGDQPAPPPILVQVDGTKMQLSMMLVQQMRELGQTALQGYEPLEMPRRTSEQSGKAIALLENKTDAGRSNYIQNFKDISLPLDARIVLDMIPVVYDRPGRVIHILGEEDETRPIMIGRKFVVKDGVPVPVPENSEEGDYIDFSEGKYAVVPIMGKAPQTRLEEGQEFMTNVLAAVPEMLGVMGDLAFQFRDEPGAKQIAERLKRQIQQTAPHLLDDQENSAAKTQAENQMLKAQLQQVMQQASEMAQALETEQAKQQATMVKSEMETESRERIATQNNETKLLIEEMRMEREQMEAMLSRVHEQKQNREDHAHDVAMGAAGAQTMTMKREDGSQQDSERESEQSQGRSSESTQEAENGPEATE